MMKDTPVSEAFVREMAAEKARIHPCLLSGWSGKLWAGLRLELNLGGWDWAFI